MAGQLFGIGALLSVVFLIVALLSGYGVGSLAYRSTVTGMRRAAAVNLLLLALQGMLAAVMAALMFRLYNYSWWYIWDKVMLFLPLILLPLVAVTMLSVPRLLEMTRLAGERDEAPNRTKRRSAAEAELVVPVQTLTLGAILFAFKYVYPMQPQFGNDLLKIAIVFLGLSGLLVWRQTIRRRRIHRDDGTSAFHWIRRIGVYTSACLLLAFAVNVAVPGAKTSRLVPAGYSLGSEQSAGSGGTIRLAKPGNREGGSTRLARPHDNDGGGGRLSQPHMDGSGGDPSAQPKAGADGDAQMEQPQGRPGGGIRQAQSDFAGGDGDARHVRSDAAADDSDARHARSDTSAGDGDARHARSDAAADDGDARSDAKADASKQSSASAGEAGLLPRPVMNAGEAAGYPPTNHRFGMPSLSIYNSAFGIVRIENERTGLTGPLAACYRRTLAFPA